MRAFTQAANAELAWTARRGSAAFTICHFIDAGVRHFHFTAARSFGTPALQGARRLLYHTMLYRSLWDGVLDGANAARIICSGWTRELECWMQTARRQGQACRGACPAGCSGFGVPRMAYWKTDVSVVLHANRRKQWRPAIWKT